MEEKRSSLHCLPVKGHATVTALSCAPSTADMKLQYVTASAALLVVACVVSSAAAIDTSAPLQLLSMDTGAACLDGSPYAFYFRNASTSSNTRWSINIEGGGWYVRAQPSGRRWIRSISRSTAPSLRVRAQFCIVCM